MSGFFFIYIYFIIYRSRSSIYTPIYSSILLLLLYCRVTHTHTRAPRGFGTTLSIHRSTTIIETLHPLSRVMGRPATRHPPTRQESPKKKCTNKIISLLLLLHKKQKQKKKKKKTHTNNNNNNNNTTQKKQKPTTRPVPPFFLAYILCVWLVLVCPYWIGVWFFSRFLFLYIYMYIERAYNMFYVSIDIDIYSYL